MTTPAFIVAAWRNWRSRHRHPANFALHAAGVPACFLAAPPLALLGFWAAAAMSFALGYAAQLVGHAVEGNRSGEEMLLRRLLGRLRGARGVPRSRDRRSRSS